MSWPLEPLEDFSWYSPDLSCPYTLEWTKSIRWKNKSIRWKNIWSRSRKSKIFYETCGKVRHVRKISTQFGDSVIEARRNILKSYYFSSRGRHLEPWSKISKSWVECRSCLKWILNFGARAKKMARKFMHNFPLFFHISLCWLQLLNMQISGSFGILGLFIIKLILYLSAYEAVQSQISRVFLVHLKGI